MINERKIKSPEYANSRERMIELFKIVNEGKEAEAVIKYADIFLKTKENELLEAIRAGKKHEQAILEYKVAFDFMELLKHAVAAGQQKEAVYMQRRKDIAPF